MAYQIPTQDHKQIQELLFTQLAKRDNNLDYLKQYGVDVFELQFSDRWLHCKPGIKSEV